MDLILWRHAEAEPGEPDLGRRLTAKGIKQAERVATWLDGHLPDTCRILVSPADRAQQTALALKRKFRTVAELAPGASAAALLDAAGWPDSREPVLIVGHQPSLGEVAALLLAGHPLPWSVRKGAVWWLSNRQREGAAAIVLRVVIGPDFVSEPRFTS
jgi:phosphohistidine phosphatase